MSATEKRACFGEWQLFPERTQIHEFSALKSDGCYSPILPANITGQQFSKLNVKNGTFAISVPPRKPTVIVRTH
jgi:hypothetical protein